MTSPPTLLVLFCFVAFVAHVDARRISSLVPIGNRTIQSPLNVAPNVFANSFAKADEGKISDGKEKPADQSLLHIQTKGVHQESPKASNTTEAQPTDEPMCCAKAKHGDIIQYKLMKPGKDCAHSGSKWSTSKAFPIEVKSACCDDFDEEEVRDASETQCLGGGGKYGDKVKDCRSFKAEKSEDGTKCKCTAGRTCVQLDQFIDDVEDGDPYKGTLFECEDDEFTLREQYNYGLKCMKSSDVKTCEDFGAKDAEQEGYCMCNFPDVCVGSQCEELDDDHEMGFKLAYGNILFNGFFTPEQERFLEKFDHVDMETGSHFCVPITCDAFNAVGDDPTACECEEMEYKYSRRRTVFSLPQKASRRRQSVFDAEDAWKRNMKCQIAPEDIPKCSEKGHTNVMGVGDMDDEKPYCECPYGKRCHGPNCQENGDADVYPAFMMEEHECRRR